MSDKTGIKRATLAAQREIEQLDAEALRQLEAAYRQAADDIAARIQAHSGADDNLALEEMRSVLDQVEARLRQLSERRNALVNVAIEHAAETGTEPFFGTVRSVAAMRVSDEALRFVRNFIAEDGLQLSDRIWRIDRGARDRVVNAIEQAVIQGHGAGQAAREFLAQGAALPGDVANKLNAANASALSRTAREVMTGSGSPLDNAMRLMRTEINRAHGEAYMMSGADHPDFAGWRYLLSPAHPKPDICLRKGTLVTTRNGDIAIEDVKIGDLVLTHRGRFKRVTKLYRSWFRPGYLVRILRPAANSRSLEVVMTPNHPVLTSEGWIPAGDLQTGCLTIGLPAFPFSRHDRLGDGEAYKASRDFAENEVAPGQETTCEAVCGEARRGSCSKSHSDLQDGLLPIDGRIAGAGSVPTISIPRTNSDFHRRAVAWKVSFETPPNARVVQGAACQSSDCFLPLAMGGIQLSNIFVICYTPVLRMIFRIPGRLAAWSRALSGSMTLSKKSAPVSPSPISGPENVLNRSRIPPQRDSSLPPPSIGDCKNASSWYAFPGSIGQALGRGVCRTIRNILSGSCDNNNIFSTEHPMLEVILSVGETVFNLEVEDDHSYVAGGIVVHNCDLLSTQNLHGLGEGVYPSREKCPWPAHPNTLSYIEIVFKDEISDADRAGKETSLQALDRLSTAQREGALGKGKAEIFDEGKLRQGMIRAPLGAVNKRLRR